ncbi:Or85b [Drosophila busckii]|uniref:Odorant receptor n=1 Tax=Drosophila busckii TaxID=30019 RepID=A0A0M4EW88_DROBS|nr:Or85b [Drosophila busckii]
MDCLQFKADTMPLTKMKNFMQYANFFYKAIGMDTYHEESQTSAPSFWISVVYWANIINLLAVLSGEMIYVLIAFATGEHIVDAIMVMSYIGFVLVGMSKMIFVWRRKQQLSNIMRELEELFPRGKSAQESYRLSAYLRTSSRISLTFSLMYTVLIWTYNLFGSVQYLIYDLWLQTRVVGKTLPYIMYTPWQYEDNWSYYLLLFSQNFAGYTSAAGQVATDLQLCAVTMLIIMHFDYLARNIEEHVLVGDWRKDNQFLVKSVRYHNRLLRLSDGINDIFGVPLLLNFLISSFIICFVGFQMTMGVPADLMLKLMLFLVSALSQVYMICYHGQLLVDVSSSIAEAAYKQNWQVADLRYKRALTFLIARAQKPTYLKATVFMQINRNRMTDLLQLSYKFFALLRTMYAK